MKQQIKKKFYTYLFILSIITVNDVSSNEQSDLKNVGICNTGISSKYFGDESVFGMYTTLRIIDQLKHNIEEYDQDYHYNSYDVENKHQDFVVEIINLLIGMYGKVVEATVTHYLMVDMPLNENAYEIVVKIIATDSISIMQITGKHLFLFLSDNNISWQEKLYRCAFVFGIVAIVKIGIDSIPEMVKKYANPNFDSIVNSDKSDKIESVITEDPGSFSDLFGMYK